MTWVQWKRWAMDRCYNNNTPKQQRDWKWFQANVPASHREGVYELEDDGDWYRGAYVVVEGEVTTLDSHRVCTRCKKWRLVWRYKPETFCFLGYWCIDCRKEDEGMEVRW